MAREAIPKKVKEELLAEYDYRCAVCASNRPHIHHIDEDPSNNELLNLLPLCPNCHIRDQHNPTRKIDVPKLRLFRKYKDPAILKPQFHPIYIRQLFLETVVPGEHPISPLEDQANELIEFVEALEMGQFYAKRLKELLGPLHRAYIMSLGSGPDPRYEQAVRDECRDYRLKLIANRDDARALIIELLRYQAWANVA